jgi:hypothetical protein
MKRMVNGAKRKTVGKVGAKAKGPHMGRVDKLAKEPGIGAEKNRENRRLKEEIRPSQRPRSYTS